MKETCFFLPKLTAVLFKIVIGLCKKSSQITVVKKYLICSFFLIQ